MKIFFIKDGVSELEIYPEPGLTFCRVLHSIGDQHDGVQEIYYGLEALLVKDQDDHTPQTFHKTAQEVIHKAEEYADPADRWVSLSGFRGVSRTLANVLYERTLFFDVDFHEPYTHEEASQLAFDSFYKLKEAVVAGQFPEPTMVTYTTRGLGIYFVLDRPIFHTEAARKLLDSFNMTKKCYFRWLEQVLEMKLDNQVLDASRVCRIPGFKHSKTGKWAQLLYVSHDEEGNLTRIPSLNYLIGRYREAHPVEVQRTEPQPFVEVQHTEQRQLEDQNTEATSRVSGQSGETVANNSYEYCCCVLESLRELLEMRGYCMPGHREVYIFIFYNFLSQLVPKEEAQAETLQVASFFVDENGESYELPRHEVLGAMRSVGAAKWGPVYKQRGPVRHFPDEIRGYYLFSVRELRDKLGITNEENRRLPLTQFASNSVAALRKAETEARRQRRAELIKECKEQNPELSYDGIVTKLNRLKEVKEAKMKISRRIVSKVLEEVKQQEKAVAAYNKHLIAKYLVEHPEVRGYQVAEKFDVSPMFVSKIKQNLEELLVERSMPESIPEPPKIKEKKVTLNLTFQNENKSLCIGIKGDRYYRERLEQEAEIVAYRDVLPQEPEIEISPEIWDMVEEALEL